MPGRIDDDADRALGARLLDPVDDVALVVRLAEDDLPAELLGLLAHQLLDVGERRAAVLLRLTRAEQIEVGSVEDVNGVGHGGSRVRRTPGSVPMSSGEPL